MEFIVGIVILWLISLGILRLYLVMKLTKNTLGIPNIDNKSWKLIQRMCYKHFSLISKHLVNITNIDKTFAFRSIRVDEYGRLYFDDKWIFKYGDIFLSWRLNTSATKLFLDEWPEFWEKAKKHYVQEIVLFNDSVIDLKFKINQELT